MSAYLKFRPKRRALIQGGPLIKFFFMIVGVTGPRRLENDLVVTGKFTTLTKSATIGPKLKEQIMHVKELCKRMELETTISDLRWLNAVFKYLCLVCHYF